MSTEFQKIKDFFLAHQTGYVCYAVEDTDAHLYSDYFSPPPKQDCFYLYFDGGWRECDPARYYIDPYDSFTFGISFVDYGDRVEVTDGNRTWECCCEAFEGNGLLGKHIDMVSRTTADFGFLPISLDPFTTELHKVTTPETCARDAVALVKLMLMCNRLSETHPYLHDDASVEEVVSALNKTWNL